MFCKQSIRIRSWNSQRLSSFCNLSAALSDFSRQATDIIKWQTLSLEDILQLLHSGKKEPSVDDLTHLLQKFGQERNLEYAKRLYLYIANRGNLGNGNVLCTHAISMFAECGSLQLAQRLFDQVGYHDGPSWISIISAYIQCGKWQQGLNLYSKMRECQAYPCSSYTLIALLKACARLNYLEKGQDIHVLIIHQGYEGDVFIGSTLVDMYAKCGSVFEAQHVLHKLSDRNAVTWNALLAGYIDSGLEDEVLSGLRAMTSDGVSPSPVTLSCALKACKGKVENGMELHDEIILKGFENDLFVGTRLIEMYAANGFLVESHNVLDNLPVRDFVSWSALIVGYCEHGDPQQAIKCFKDMQSEGICPDAAMFPSLLKGCSNMFCIRSGQEFHIEIVKRGLEIDPFVSSTLVDMYSKCQSLKDAKDVFIKIPEKTIVPWNALLVGYAENGPFEEAVTCFQQAQGFISPNAVSYSSILKVFGTIDALSQGRKVHQELVQKGLEADTFVGNSLVDMYSKTGSTFEAQAVFNRLEEQTIVTWTALIAGYVEHGPVHEALNCFEEMISKGFIPDAALFACVLKACSSIGSTEKAEQMHKVVVAFGLESDPLVSNGLIDMYVKCGLLLAAREVFYKLSEKNLFSWTSLISVYAEKGFGEEALRCFEQMQMEGLLADAPTLACGLKSCTSIAALDRGKIIHKEIVQRGLDNKETIASSMVDMYSKIGSPLEAQVSFCGVKNPNVGLWNSLITGYVETGSAQEALECFNQMQLKGMYSDSVTYVSVLRACECTGAIDKGGQLHQEVLHKGLEGDNFIGNTLVTMYASFGMLSDAQKVFDKLQVKCAVSWNALIAGYVEQECSHKALDYYDHMQLDGVCQTSITYISGLKACGNTGALDKGQDIHRKVTHVGYETDNAVGSTLVDMYVKYGSILDARLVFDKLSTRDVVAWNAMIKGYGLNHNGDIAVQFFLDMQEKGVQPTSVTFICLLTACSHNNLLVEGQEYFRIMKDKYDITPSYDHYSCIIDLFARAGCLVDAERFLESLPYTPSKDIWLPLLTACQNYVEVDIGHKCFQKLVDIHPNCGTTYMLMSSIYVSAGMWDEITKIEQIKQCSRVASPHLPLLDEVICEL